MSKVIDYWINRRELQQELALSSLEYDTRQTVERIIDRMKTIDISERDEGKEPVLESGTSIHHEVHWDGTGEIKKTDYLDWKCPTCGWFVGELYSGHGRWHIQGETSYCAKCGQRIDWTKPDEEEKRRYEERKAKEREEFERKHKMRLDNMHESRRVKYGVTNDGCAADKSAYYPA